MVTLTLYRSPLFLIESRRCSMGLCPRQFGTSDTVKPVYNGHPWEMAR